MRETRPMTLSELETFLKQSLADRALSGGEKSALADWLSEHARSNQDRGVVRHALFDAARAASASLDTAQLLEWLEDAMKVVAPIEPNAKKPAIEPSDAFFSPGTACLERIIHRFKAARRTVDVCVFTITDDRIARAMLDAHRRGVKLRLITDNDKAYDLGSDIREFEAAGISTKIDRTHAHMHHKFAIFDGTRLLNGSYNWTRSAAEVNEENLVDTGDPDLVEAFAAEFKKLWNHL